MLPPAISSVLARKRCNLGYGRIAPLKTPVSCRFQGSLDAYLPPNLVFSESCGAVAAESLAVGHSMCNLVAIMCWLNGSTSEELGAKASHRNYSPVAA